MDVQEKRVMDGRGKYITQLLGSTNDPLRLMITN